MSRNHLETIVFTYEDMDYTIRYIFSPRVPARTNCRAEDAEPEEPAEVDIIRISPDPEDAGHTEEEIADALLADIIDGTID